MKFRLFLLVTFAALSSLPLFAADKDAGPAPQQQAAQQAAAPAPQRDRAKTLAIELPVKRLLAEARPSPPQLKPGPPQPKMAIELPVKRLLVEAQPVSPKPAPPQRDIHKKDVEIPSKAILAERFTPSGPSVAQPTTAPEPVAAHTTVGDNPKVAPGNVRWHKDFDTARAASKASGKPVLLFQMMGNLDDRFC